MPTGVNFLILFLVVTYAAETVLYFYYLKNDHLNKKVPRRILWGARFIAVAIFLMQRI